MANGRAGAFATAWRRLVKKNDVAQKRVVNGSIATLASAIRVCRESDETSERAGESTKARTNCPFKDKAVIVAAVIVAAGVAAATITAAATARERPSQPQRCSNGSHRCIRSNPPAKDERAAHPLDIIRRATLIIPVASILFDPRVFRVCSECFSPAAVTRLQVALSSHLPCSIFLKDQATTRRPVVFLFFLSSLFS